MPTASLLTKIGLVPYVAAADTIGAATVGAVRSTPTKGGAEAGLKLVLLPVATATT